MPQQAHVFATATKPIQAPVRKAEPAKYRLIEQFKRFETDAGKWTILEHNPSHPAHDYAWLRSCAEMFATDEHLAFVTVGGADPSAVAPLVKRGRILKRLECLGVDELYEPTDFPHNDSDALKALVRTIVKLGYPLHLKRVTADSPLVSTLRAAIGRRGVLVVQPVSGYPWLQLEPSWIEPEAKLSPSRRSALRLARRHAESIGVVSFEIHTPDHTELDALLEEAYRVEAAGWKGRGRSSLLSDRSRRAFFDRYAETIRHKSTLRLCFMRIDGRAVAMQLAVECHNRLWFLKIGYDEEYARCSPGNLLMAATVRWATERGLESIELLGTVEPWTQVWTQDVRECVAIRAYPMTMSGLSGLSLDATRYLWARFQRVPH